MESYGRTHKRTHKRTHGSTHGSTHGRRHERLLRETHRRKHGGTYGETYGRRHVMGEPTEEHMEEPRHGHNLHLLQNYVLLYYVMIPTSY